jgi:hydroxymethylpyrimidine pyrophosphatase-like HAD family hydrolase
MRYRILACDYDGTLADHGRLLDATRVAIERVRGSGRKVLLVTGRRLDDLRSVCPDLSPFELIVAENGAVLYRPSTNDLRLLAPPPPAAFVERLREQGVPDVAVGAVIVATWHPHEGAVLEVIRELGLELGVIFNKGAVMVLPSGVNKATGLQAALASLCSSRHEVVAVGDAENDHAFLAAASCGVAVQNALPMLKQRADWVTERGHGAGVSELIDRLVENDLAELREKLRRHDIPLGRDANGAWITLPAYGSTVLLAGTSGGGKSTLITAIVEQLGERGYQYCIVDPEGDYGDLPGAAVLGDRKSAPSVQEVLKLLEKPSSNCVVNLVGTGIESRPSFFETLIPPLMAMRTQTARPHFIVIDETHHLAPHTAGAPRSLSSGEWINVVMVTVHPRHVSPALLARVNIVMAVGASPADTFAEFAASVGREAPGVEAGPLESGEAMVWFLEQGARAHRIRTITPDLERTRHVRKYAVGDLEDRSFFFRGPEGKLNLKAQNLTLFAQLADGVDDDTWQFHLVAGDYSRWMRACIKDDELADEVQAVEAAAEERSPRDTRAEVRQSIERRYTAPA